MSAVKRSLAFAFLLALGSTLVPVSLSPTGGLEVDELCADGTCKRAPGQYCMDQGTVLFNYKMSIG